MLFDIHHSYDFQQFQKFYFLKSELVITTGIAINEANAEIETQPVTVEFKISKCST